MIILFDINWTLNMKINYFLLIPAFIILISCQEESETPIIENQLTENILEHTETYSWEKYNTDNRFGEVLYIPVYSSIYHQSDMTFDLTATLSIDNTDLTSNITITKIDYYDTNGKFVRNFIENEIELSPLQTKQFIIKENDISGGTAAKFIIQWVSEIRVQKPVVEAIMISTSAQQGISFKTESKTISSIGY